MQRNTRKVGPTPQQESLDAMNGGPALAGLASGCLSPESLLMLQQTLGNQGLLDLTSGDAGILGDRIFQAGATESSCPKPGDSPESEPVAVHQGGQAEQALELLGAPAAYSDGHILLGNEASERDKQEEFVHADQDHSHPSAAPPASVSNGHEPAEVEARQLTQRDDTDSPSMAVTKSVHRSGIGDWFTELKDSVTSTASGIANSVAGTLSSGWDLAGDLANSGVERATALASQAVTGVSDFAHGVSNLAGSAWQAGSDQISNLWEWGNDKVDEGQNWISETANNAWGQFTEGRDELKCEAFGHGAGCANQGDYSVANGDSLWAIAEDALGDGGRWPEIYELNKDSIGSDPNHITAGMVLKMPTHSVEVDSFLEMLLHALDPANPELIVKGDLLDYFRNHETTEQINQALVQHLEQMDFSGEQGTLSGTFEPGLVNYGGSFREISEWFELGNWVVRNCHPQASYTVSYTQDGDNLRVQWAATWRIQDDFDVEANEGDGHGEFYSAVANYFTEPVWHELMGGQWDVISTLEWEEKGGIEIKDQDRHEAEEQSELIQEGEPDLS